MLRAKNIWVVGGDPRQAALAALLADDGHSVHTYALEQGEGAKCEPSMDGADRADCVVLPLPAAGPDGTLNAPLSAGNYELAEVLDALRPGQLVCAGMAGEHLKAMAEERGLVLRDYFAREELAVLNAIPAALAVWQREPDFRGCANLGRRGIHCSQKVRKGGLLWSNPPIRFSLDAWSSWASSVSCSKKGKSPRPSSSA